MKIRIHPAFIAAALLMIFTGNAVVFCAYTVAIVAHEIAHARMAALRGYTLGTITLMPYGGVINGGTRYSRSDNILIAVAGPLFNVVVALLITAVWWLYPDSYVYTQDFCTANLALAAVNVLPLYPLDGSRVVLSLCKNKLRALKILKAAGVITGALFTVLSAVSIFYKYNLSIGIMGVFLAYSAMTETDEEAYVHVTSLSPLNKHYDEGVEKRVVVISADMPLMKVLPLVRRDSITTFEVMSEGRSKASFGEERLTDMCVDNPLSCTVGEALGLKD